MTKTDGEIYHPELEESILWKWLYYSKAIYRFNGVPVKIPIAFFTKTRTINFTIYMETQKTGVQKITRHWWKKSKTTQTEREIYHVLGLEASIL